MSKMNDAKHVGEGLRRLRLHHDFKQEIIADALQCSKSFVSELEHGTRLLNVHHLAALSTVYKMPIYELVYFLEHYKTTAAIRPQISKKLHALLNAQMYLNV